MALAEADAKIKGQFLQEALSSAEAKFSAAGQTTVEQGADGITLTDEKTKNQMRLIGGAILMGVQDENGQRVWKTGLTPDGISASLITAGTVNTGNIAIMNGTDITFKLDAMGMTALDTTWENGAITGTPNKHKFVRFDKFGIYGINDAGSSVIDGTTWSPKNSEEIDEKSTFSLTWDGLKVINGDTVANIGKSDGYIMRISKGTNNLFTVDTEGNVHISSQVRIGGSSQATNSSLGDVVIVDEKYWLSNDGAQPNEDDPNWSMDYPTNPNIVW